MLPVPSSGDMIAILSAIDQNDRVMDINLGGRTWKREYFIGYRPVFCRSNTAGD